MKFDNLKINWFNLTTFVCLSQARTWISSIVEFSMFNELRWGVIVHFVEIGRFIDHHCLNIINLSNVWNLTIWKVTGLTPPHFWTLISIVICCGLFFMLNELRWEVIVRLVKIGGIIDHHCLNYLFIILTWDYDILDLVTLVTCPSIVNSLTDIETESDDNDHLFPVQHHQLCSVNE